MKICAIQDIHGADDWKSIINKEKNKVDKFIFIGDYVDNNELEITPEEQLRNFYEICDLADEYDVEYLIGNHDYQYISQNSRTNNYNKAFELGFAAELTEMIQNGSMKLIAQYGNFVFSHAGISDTWLRINNLQLNTINDKFRIKHRIAEFISKEDSDKSGDNIYQSPIWIRPNSLLNDNKNDIHQIVGHTEIEEITTICENGSITFICNPNNDYLIVDLTADEIKICKL